MTSEFTVASVEQYFGFRSNWITTRAGERIHYLDEGNKNGIPVIMLHGSAIGITAAANFYLTIPALVEADFRAIAPDLYGYGWTEAPEGVRAVRTDQVDQICRLMETLGLESAYLIGNSLGGMITTSMSLWHPQKVRGNIVIGTGGARWEHGSRFESNPSSRSMPEAYSREVVLRSMEHLVSNPEFLPEKLLEYRIQMAERPGAWERYREATQQREEAKRTHPFDEALAQKSSVPTLFIFGKDDRVNPPEDALAGAEAFQHADLIVFGHCGHWTMIERAEDFNALMVRFIQGYDKRIVTPGKPGVPRASCSPQDKQGIQNPVLSPAGIKA
jgi:pimeloyl-ACP methyl ester carboxylesterase